MSHSEFRCPLTKLIYFDPVLAEDGHIYERMAIEKWFEDNRISPITSEIINKKLINVYEFKILVDKYLDTHVDMHSEQFMIKRPYNLFRNEFIEKLKKNDYNDLEMYTEILLNDNINLNYNIIKYLCEKCRDSIKINNIINNSVDYDMEDIEGYKPINYVFKFCEASAIYHLLKKNIDYNFVDNQGKNLIHYVCIYHPNNPELIKFLLDLKIDPNFTDSTGNRPIHYLIQKTNTYKSLELFLDRNISVDTYNKDGWTPLHLLCRYNQNIDCIKFIFDQKINLKIIVKTLTDEEVTCEKLLFENPYFNREEKQDLIFYYLNKVLFMSNVDHNFVDKLKKN